MPQRVLILSFARDLHAVAARARLRQMGADADIVDTSAFPEQLSLVHSSGATDHVRLGALDLADYRSIWWRRTHPPRVPDDVTDPEERRFAARECREGLFGALQASGVPILNDPRFEERAGFKPYQLRMAREQGLRVPETVVTNDPEAARDFARRHEHVVYKGFSGTQLIMTDTRPLRAEDIDDLWRLRFAPVIFQRYLPRAREYRVMLVEDLAFVAEIKIRQAAAHYDWRLDPTYETVPAQLPAELIARLQHLRRGLGLHSGAVDLRETPDGEIYFLEINPSGQFLFMDVNAGMDTLASFCEMLLRASSPPGLARSA